MLPEGSVSRNTGVMLHFKNL